MRVTEETKAATRQRILDVAQRQFAAGGFEATTTRDIARTARIAAGTLFNYFPTKEAIVAALVIEAWEKGAESFASSLAWQRPDADRAHADDGQPLSLEEALFAHVAAILRKLRPNRKYLSVVLETTLSPLAGSRSAEAGSALRAAHLEMVGQIVAHYGADEALTPVALQLYWTLLAGVFAFWSQDKSPRQEDTLALLDQSLAMFVAWLTEAASPTHNEAVRKRG